MLTNKGKRGTHNLNLNNPQQQSFPEKEALTTNDEFTGEQDTVRQFWINMFAENAYPTYKEQVLFSQQTGYPLEQINLWFIEARIQLKLNQTDFDSVSREFYATKTYAKTIQRISQENLCRLWVKQNGREPSFKEVESFFQNSGFVGEIEDFTAIFNHAYRAYSQGTLELLPYPFKRSDNVVLTHGSDEFNEYLQYANQLMFDNTNNLLRSWINECQRQPNPSEMKLLCEMTGYEIETLNSWFKDAISRIQKQGPYELSYPESPFQLTLNQNASNETLPSKDTALSTDQWVEDFQKFKIDDTVERNSQKLYEPVVQMISEFKDDEENRVQMDIPVSRAPIFSGDDLRQRQRTLSGPTRRMAILLGHLNPNDFSPAPSVSPIPKENFSTHENSSARGLVTDIDVGGHCNKPTVESTGEEYDPMGLPIKRRDDLTALIGDADDQVRNLRGGRPSVISERQSPSVITPTSPENFSAYPQHRRVRLVFNNATQNAKPSNPMDVDVKPAPQQSQPVLNGGFKNPSQKFRL